MSDPGLTTPVQPVRAAGSRGRGIVAAGLVLVLVVGLLAWHPWVGPPEAPPIGVASVAPSSDGGLLDRGPLGGPLTGTWTGRVAAKWSIVAFLRADPVSPDPVSPDPLDLRQEEVTVFLGPVHPPISRAPEYCDTVGPTGERSAAELPTREVRFLGIAFPTDQAVVVDGVRRARRGVRRDPGRGRPKLECRSRRGRVHDPEPATGPRIGRSERLPGTRSGPDVRVPRRRAVAGRPVSLRRGHGRWRAGPAVRLYPSVTSVSGRRPSTPSRRRSRGASRCG